MINNIKQDIETVNADGSSITCLPEGLNVKDLTTHIDERGQVFEMYDLRWNFHPDPLVFAYQFTVRPGVVKGWGIHKKHEDRYCLLYGEMEAVFYDDRPDSPTYHQVSTLHVSHYQRKLFNIPAGVWHAIRNIGSTDMIVVNFPTIPYDHTDPDKYRLPLDTDYIPYTFESNLGW